MFRDAGSRQLVDGDVWTPRCSPACAAYGDRFVVLFGGSAVPADISDAARDLNDVVVFDVAAPRAPAWRAENRESLQITGIGGHRDGLLTIERCNRMGAPVETLHTFEWHEMSVSGARATFDKLAADTRGDSWLELRRGPLIELTSEWRVRTPTPAVRNAASLTSLTTIGGEEALVLFGGGVYPNTYYNDTHVLRLEDLPAASAAPEKPPPALANLCQAAVAGEITDDNVFEILMFADDRQLADLRTACLEHIQRRWNSNLHNWWHNTDGCILPGADAALQAPSLRSDVERALRGI